MLLEIKNYLSHIKSANMLDISRHFNSSADALRPMLEIWERKGCIKKANKLPGCGSSCQRCSPLFTEVYVWKGL